MKARPHDASLLVADIGGSNARFGWVAGAGAPVGHVRALPVAAYDGPGNAAADYLAGLAAMFGAGWRPPSRAALAVATAVTGDRVVMTNSPWSFSCRELRDTLALDELKVLNDFEALALALPHLQPHQWRAHGKSPGGALVRAVIGPGTGLGVAAAVPNAGGWLAVPGEGGHATLAAADDFEAEVIAFVRGEHPHVSAERLLSGTGLPLLHRAVAAVAGAPAEAAPPEAREIVARASAGDERSLHTLRVFCAMLGGFAGNVALTLGARGGLYIGGGIVPRFAELFFASRFRERFEAKGRFAAYLAAVPTALITDTMAALTGAAAALRDEAPARRRG